ncbi:MAG: Type 1 glutamine amidotransferase-like domain-containing protein [Candidatus Paceibacteria bacterium]
MTEDFETDCSNADAIYFHGGNTPTLLAALKDYGDIERLFTGKTVAGSSAGAYMLSAYGAAHTSEHFRQGLGILNVRVICHFESTELPPSPTSLAEIYSTHLDLPLVVLRDCESKVFFK